MISLHDPGASPRTFPSPATNPALLRRKVTAELSTLLGDPSGLELTSSCTHALEAAATLLEVGRGDEVVVPAFAFPSVANAFLIRGARIRFADVDPATGNIDPASVAKRLGPRTRAVVCIHYAGVPADLDALEELGAGRQWDLVEDAAHALFASHRGRALGTLGTYGCLSFHHTKNISCGDGGALVMNDPATVERARIALDKGTNRADFEAGVVASYEWSGVGSAWRLADPFVTLLAERIDMRGQIQARRHELWDSYARSLGRWAELNGAGLMRVPPDAVHPAHIFWILLPEQIPRDDFVAHCASAGIEVARHFGSLPVSSFGSRVADPSDVCPNSQRFADQLVRLPLHPAMTDSEIDRVVCVVESFS